MTTIPEPNTLVEVTGSNGPVCGVRVDAAQDAELTLSLPPDTPGSRRPSTGDEVVLRWPAGARGRYAVDGTVAAATGDRLRVQSAGEHRIEQARHYVRGGGGEPVRLHVAGAAEMAGQIRDISERGVRAHFTEAEVRDGDVVRLTVQLGADTIDVMGTALKVAELPPGAGPGAARVELIAAFEADERQAQVIRRYVLRHQMKTRSRTGGED